MSTAFHPHTDGQSEIINKTIAMYLRCITGDRPCAWLEWLPWAKYSYKTSYHSTIRTTPFKVVYGQPLSALLPYTARFVSTETVDVLLRDRNAFLSDVHDHLLQAQEYAKKHYNNHHQQLEFVVDDWVWLCLLHWLAQSLVLGPRGKLSPGFTGPFQVAERIGPVVYRLRLPEGARIHDVIDVGILKPFRGSPPSTLSALPPLHNGRLLRRSDHVVCAQLHGGA